MKPRHPYRITPEEQRKRKRVLRLEWLTIALVLSIVVVMYFTMGSSQAMKTAWIEDMLALVPPFSFIIAERFRNKAPDQRFPYGYQQTTLLSFLVSAVAILVMGLYMLYDAASGLLAQEHPTIGHFDRFGLHVWAGWGMIGALVYSVIPPLILGHFKMGLGRDLQERTVLADATMNKDDWQTGAAAMLGVLGIGAGLWWADSAAAAFISINVIKDGVTHLRQGVMNLLDQRPTDAEKNQPLQIDRKLQDALEQDEAVKAVDVRLRGEGPYISGEVFVVMHKQAVTPEELEGLKCKAEAVDHRFYGLTVTPVGQLED